MLSLPPHQVGPSKEGLGSGVRVQQVRPRQQVYEVKCTAGGELAVRKIWQVFVDANKTWG